ncbi:MAG: exodeoxyribonuclease VII large subunit [Alphaproteobacteria bacterium]
MTDNSALLGSSTERSPHNLPEFTVSEISVALKQTLEDRFGRVRVKGELTGFKRHTSGHLYFRLKDESAVLEGVCWRGTAGRLGLRPEDGMEVVCIGRITAYPGRSQYQIVVEAMELAGVGALLKLLEERRQRLLAEGLFAPERKRALPFLPEVIGVVTSPTGAVIRDILHRLAERFPRRVLIWPVAVQGEGAAEQVAGAIRGFNALPPGGRVPRPDLLIVARGGGSLEDLWPFNEEVVVRAAAASVIPLISAVGHETDTTLIDFAADRRAPTPTAAAEMAVPVRAELLARVLDDARRLAGTLLREFAEQRTLLEGLARALGDPRRILEGPSQRLDFAADSLRRAMRAEIDGYKAEIAELAAAIPHPRHVIALKRQSLKAAVAGLSLRSLKDDIRRAKKDVATAGTALVGAIERIRGDAVRRLEGAAGLLESLSYERVLERGFALVRDESDHPLTTVAAARPGMAVTLRFHDGEAGATIDGSPATPARPPSRPSRKGGGGQGSLL